MSVTTINEIADSQACNDTTDKRTYTAAYRVLTSDPGDGSAVVLAAMDSAGHSLSAAYSFDNDSDSDATMKSRQPRRVDGDRKTWVVICTWETPDAEEEEDQNRDDAGEVTPIPWDWYGLVEIDHVIQQSIVNKAKRITAIPTSPRGSVCRVTNSAGQIKDPPPTKDEAFTLLRLQKNFRAFNADIADVYVNSVNTDAVTLRSPYIGFQKTIAPFRGKIQKIGGAYRVKNGYPYWEVSTEILITPATTNWRHYEFDEGMHGLGIAGRSDGEGGTINSTDITTGRVELFHIRDTRGNKVTKPVPFDGQGKPARAVGGRITEVYLEYQIYNEFPWGALLRQTWQP